MWRIIVSLYRADLVTDYGEEEAGQMMTEGLRQYYTEPVLSQALGQHLAGLLFAVLCDKVRAVVSTEHCTQVLGYWTQVLYRSVCTVWTVRTTIGFSH
jgi:hypothetical protein